MSRKEREGVLWVLLAAAGFALMPTMVKTTYRPFFLCTL